MSMSIVSAILVAIVALEHVYFLYLEMFAWTKPSTRKTFGTTEDFAEKSKTLAANQGLYNGFLAAGLIWSIVAPSVFQKALGTFFLGCVIIAGIYGGVTVRRRIIFVQSLPAAIGLLSLMFL